MNIQEYIDSGVLELYAAGGLTPTENVDVEQMAEKHPEVRMALEEALRSMEAYALIHARAPNPELEEIIIQKMLAGTATSEEDTSAGAKVLPFNPVASAEYEYTQPQTQSWWQMAAVILLVISAAANVYLYSNLKETRQELVSVQQDSRQYALQVNQLEQRSVQSENLLGILKNPKTLAISLKGVEKHPEAKATVFWNQDTKEVYLDPVSLPTAPTGKQYQLWALAQGKPVDAGVVKAMDSTLVKMKAIEEAQAFAVTLEPEGGSVNPSLDEMYVMGESSSK